MLAKAMIKKEFSIENHEVVASTQLSRSSFSFAICSLFFLSSS